MRVAGRKNFGIRVDEKLSFIRGSVATLIDDDQFSFCVCLFKWHPLRVIVWRSNWLHGK